MLIAWRGEEKVGVIAYSGAYVFDLVTDPRFPEVAAMLIQRVTMDLKRKGYERAVFTIKPENPALAILVIKGKYRLDELIVSCQL